MQLITVLYIYTSVAWSERENLGLVFVRSTLVWECTHTWWQPHSRIGSFIHLGTVSAYTGKIASCNKAHAAVVEQWGVRFGVGVLTLDPTPENMQEGSDMFWMLYKNINRIWWHCWCLPLYFVLIVWLRFVNHLLNYTTYLLTYPQKCHVLNCCWTG